jgi:ribosome-binding protein aMBF1 (putative translation factor)
VEGARKKWCAACAKERHNEREKARYRARSEAIKKDNAHKKPRTRPEAKEKPLSLDEVERLRAAVNRTRRAAGMSEYTSYGKFMTDCGEDLRALYAKHWREM